MIPDDDVRCLGGLQQNYFWSQMTRSWTPESISTAHLITRYEAGLNLNDWQNDNSERNNLFSNPWNPRARAQIRMIMAFPAPPQRLNLKTQPGGNREAA